MKRTVKLWRGMFAGRGWMAKCVSDDDFGMQVPSFVLDNNRGLSKHFTHHVFSGAFMTFSMFFPLITVLIVLLLLFIILIF